MLTRREMRMKSGTCGQTSITTLLIGTWIDQRKCIANRTKQPSLLLWRTTLCHPRFKTRLAGQGLLCKMYLSEALLRHALGHGLMPGQPLPQL